MKMRATVSFTYEVPDENAEEAYGTTNPVECAKVDEDGFEDNPAILFELMENSDEVNILVDPIE